MSAPVVANSPKMIYDSGFGFNVPKLARDETIPVIQKYPGMTWTPVFTVNGQELQLLKLLKDKNIVSYLPVTKTREPIFPKLVFAALDHNKKDAIANELLIMKIGESVSTDNGEEIFAELVFMTMAEQISRHYPFSYVKVLPCCKPGEIMMPLTINDYGDCRIVTNEKRESSQIYFNFKSVDKILKFNLTLYQFRTLLLSKFLFTN